MAKKKYKRIRCEINNDASYQQYQNDMDIIDTKVDIAYKQFKVDFEAIAVDILKVLFPFGYTVTERYKNGTSTLIYADVDPKLPIQITFKFQGAYSFNSQASWKRNIYTERANTIMTIDLPGAKSQKFYAGWDGGRIQQLPSMHNTYQNLIYVLYDPKSAVNSIIASYKTFHHPISKLFDSRIVLGGLAPPPQFIN